MLIEYSRKCTLIFESVLDLLRFQGLLEFFCESFLNIAINVFIAKFWYYFLGLISKKFEIFSSVSYNAINFQETIDKLDGQSK